MAVKLIEQLLAPPQKLLFREDKLRETLELLRGGESLVIRGPVGVGKTTLALMAAKGFKQTYINCFQCRTYDCIRRRIAPGLIILDDYTLAKRTAQLVRLVKELPWKLVVIHPQLQAEELKDLPIVELKPYTLQELEEILRERVIRLNLPLSDYDIRLAAEEGVRRGGNARIALLKLAELAGLTASWQA
ncbi:hypothetical protein MA03_07195 [Infirmifilum uzonense]|uniref:Novel STAND NTPase 3 domain-containing protein n=1 Tax=Infirmifilum uzonense TaxID=1550241 RepID=A0A0F7FJ88_9CREN|nr:hypothetical protein MA03_07195 [Infirmifilum uzonense]